MTAFIVQISLGDTPQNSIQFKSLFAVASVLFVMTFVLNVISNRVIARFRNAYE
jgi:phosphate transport system permease protein